MLLCCFSEALYCGLASHGTLTTLQHFYDEHFFRSKMVFRNLKKAMLDGDVRECSSKDATPFLKVRSRDTKRVQNRSKKSLARNTQRADLLLVARSMSSRVATP